MNIICDQKIYDLKKGDILTRKFPIKEKCEIIDITKYGWKRMFCFRGFMVSIEGINKMFEIK